MSIIVSILIFLVVLFMLVLVHEWGHYITAKLTGMRVDAFGIGFPPTLWSKKVGETTYELNALPIGGYVKILGEDGTEDGESLTEADQARTFGARPKWAQALVLIAGVTMNMVFAWVLLVAISLGMIGGERSIPESEYSAKARLVAVEVLPGSPAEGKIPPGATISALIVKGNEMSLAQLTPSRFSAAVAEAAGTPVVVTYEFESETKTVTITPTPTVLEGVERSVVGVSLALVAPVEYGVIGAVIEGTQGTVELTKRVAGGIFSFFGDIFSGQADFASVAGPVGIVGVVDDAAQVGIISILYLTALISINLAVINLLPIPALDGGRLLMVVVEAIIRRPLPAVLAGRVNFLGFLFLIGVMVAVTVSDVWKLF